jgi:hypothetical protein
MTRRLWIVGLSIAVVVYSGFVIVCIAALIAHKHVDMRELTILLLGAYAGYFAFGRLRVVLKHGDPTRDSDPKVPE